MEVLRHSRHLRNFPGQGDYPIVEFLRELLAIGYDDVISHEIFNDEFRIAPPDQTAADGLRSMRWLEEQAAPTGWAGEATLIAAPKPTIEGISFVEFAAPGPAERADFDAFLTGLGFRPTHRHRSKAVDLYTRGGAFVAVNTEPDSHARRFAERHGAAACAVGLITDDPARAMARATAFLAPELDDERRAPGEASLPAVTGVGDVIHYFVGRDGRHFLETDFLETGSAGDTDNGGPDKSAPDGPDLWFDHLGIAVAPHEQMSAVLFYRAVLGFERQPTQELVDPHGMVMSRAVHSANGAVRLAITTSSGGDTAPERFRATARGSGIQQIALATPSIADLVGSIDPAVVLAVPDNYYVDLATRFRLPDQTITFLRDHNILYDESDDGAYLHLYTREIHGVFFEFVERQGYDGFGAVNAPVRLAAQARARAATHTATSS